MSTRLAASSHAVGQPALEEDRVEQRACGVDCSRVACRAAAHDADLAERRRNTAQKSNERKGAAHWSMPS